MFWRKSRQRVVVLLNRPTVDLKLRHFQNCVILEGLYLLRGLALIHFVA